MCGPQLPAQINLTSLLLSIGWILKTSRRERGAWLNLGGSTPQFLGPELTEVQFNAVRGGNKGDIDNIHDFLKNKGLFYWV